MKSQPNLDRFNSRRSTVYGTRGVVSTSQPLAAESGIDVLRNGGNAFDAAVATAAVLNVVEPMSTGLGGDMFAIYRTADDEIGAFRACGGAPEQATPGAIRSVVDSDEMPDRGALTVTVPGAPHGWETLLKEFGRRPMESVLGDAIRYARDGFPVTEVIASMWEDSAELLIGDDARETYLVDGKRAPRVGEQFTNAPLADTLSTLARRGSDPFYEGEIAETIVETVERRGGLLRKSDLEGFSTEFVDPITTSYGGVDVYELPPNTQGMVALEALNIAEELGCTRDGLAEPERVHRLIEAMKLAMHDGKRYITDPEYESIPALADEGYAADRAATVGDTASEPSVGHPKSAAEDADTVLLTVADGDGNVVSFINSIFHDFGSGVVAGSTGITLQNRGASFSLDPDHPNSVAPGKRPFHTLIPGLARFGADDWAAFGVMGGYMQPQGHLQVLTNLIDKEMTLQEALDEPRWRYMSDGSVAVEGRFDATVAAKLARRGHNITFELPVEFGGGQIARNDSGTLSGATEPRKDGTAATY
jgi:gamma-glutamyltranspeptidase/glutathione hydrolase